MLRGIKENLKWWHWGALLFLGWYLFEIALHYFLQRPLWNDELCILYNIEHLQGQDLFSHTLFKDQTFPRTYLYLIQLVSDFYHHSILSLRFFPFVSMLAAVFVWMKIAQRELKERAFFLFVLSWAASGMLVYYSAELKQYSFDVLVSGLFLLFFQRQRELTFKKTALIVCLLPVLGLFSYTVFFFVILLSWNLIILAIKDIRYRYVLGVYAAVCVAVFYFIYFYDLRWTDRNLIAAYPQYFVSVKSIGVFFKTFTEGINNLISRWFVDKPLWLRFITRFFMVFGLIEMFTGIKCKFKEDREKFYSISTIAPVLFLELVIFSIFKVFPFRLPRAILFFCPVLFMLTIQFFVRLEKKWKGFSFFLQALFACFLLFMAGFTMFSIITHA